jgi:hypothetical protein
MQSFVYSFHFSLFIFLSSFFNFTFVPFVVEFHHLGFATSFVMEIFFNPPYNSKSGMNVE